MRKDKEEDVPVHHHLTAACADSVDDAPAFFDASDLTNRFISICINERKEKTKAP